jgi:hypothetical protein
MTTKLIHHYWNDRKFSKELVTDAETILHAYSEYGRELLVADDGYGPVWTYGQEFGTMAVVRADSFESALEAVYDVLPTVPEDELYEAYGFNSNEELQKAEADEEWPELAEGYSYQANASGTGVVYHGHHEGLTELTPKDFEGAKISIVVELADDEEN